MYRHSKALNQASRKVLVSALIQCHLLMVPGSKQTVDELQVAQNKLVRFILNAGPRSHIGQTELDSVGLLNTADRAKQLMLTHMYNIYHIITYLPCYLPQ